MSLFVVSGGTSGIGKDTVLRLLENGHDVTAIGRTIHHIRDLQAQAETLTGTLSLVVGDLTVAETTNEVIRTTGSRPIAGLVNSVGMISRGGVSTETLRGWQRTLSVNLDAAFLLTQGLLSQLKASPTAAIVNVSSSCSSRPCESLAYSVSKAGLDMFTKHLAQDLAADGIRVNSVNPGVVRTNLQLSSGLFSNAAAYDSWVESMNDSHPLGVGAPEDVSAVILFLLSAESSWVTGAIVQVDGGRSVSC